MAIAAFKWRAATLNPAKLTLGIHTINTSLGGYELFAYAPVHSVAQDADGVSWSVVTPRGSVKAGKVVFCTNAYSQAVVPELEGLIIPTKGERERDDELLYAADEGSTSGQVVCCAGGTGRVSPIRPELVSRHRSPTPRRADGADDVQLAPLPPKALLLSVSLPSIAPDTGRSVSRGSFLEDRFPLIVSR
jgi:glycine/D-amino acid oxidase-like deaminating enzyme